MYQAGRLLSFGILLALFRKDVLTIMKKVFKRG